MKIESIPYHSAIYTKYKRIKRFLLITYLVLFFTIIGIFTCYFCFIPADLQIKIKRKIYKVCNDSQYRVWTYFKMNHNNDLPKLVINIKAENWNKIAQRREEALQNDSLGMYGPVLIKTSSDWVNCNLSIDASNNCESKIRLKGRLADHWRDLDYWSFDIKLKSSDNFLGMKNFSIQKPIARGYAIDWLFHQLLKENNLIYLRYGFCYVSINGEPEKLYAFEEGMNKLLIENNKLREGPIFKLNADYAFFYGVMNSIDFYNADIEFYNEKSGLNLPDQHSLMQAATNKLDAFRNGKNLTSETFDSKKWARYFALLDWMGNAHAGHYFNVRLYFNPITTLIEPIGRDFNTIEQVESKILIGEFQHFADKLAKNFSDCFFKDKIFFADYLNELNTLSTVDLKKGSLKEIINQYKIVFDLVKSHDGLAFPDTVELETTLELNSNFIFSKLNQDRKRVFAYIAKGEIGSIIYVHNADSLPVVLNSISKGKKILFNWPKNEWLPGIQKNNYIEYKQINLPDLAFDESLIEDLELHISYPGLKKIFVEPIWSHPSGSPQLSIDSLKIENNSEKFSFIHVDDSKKEIKIAVGDHVIEKPLIFPANYTIIVGPQTRINLINKAYIYSRSPIVLIGQQDKPILISSSDFSGGILILNADKESIFENVNFAGLNNINYNGLNLTGSITCYQSNVIFKNCEFSQNHCEDYLNIVRSEFRLINCLFNEIKGDAFDCDFSNGSVANSLFNNCGNDAIDTSGSNVELTNIKINGTKDKGLSFGENSLIKGNNIFLENCEIGIAAKDGSVVILDVVEIKNSHLGVTAFQKKAEFNGAKITIDKFVINNSKDSFLRDKTSAIKINKNTINAIEEKTKSLLYGNEYGVKTH